MKKLIAIIMIIGVVGYAEELKSTEKGNNYNVVDYRNDGTTYLRVGSRLTIKNGLGKSLPHYYY